MSGYYRYAKCQHPRHFRHQRYNTHKPIHVCSKAGSQSVSQSINKIEWHNSVDGKQEKSISIFKVIYTNAIMAMEAGEQRVMCVVSEKHTVYQMTRLKCDKFIFSICDDKE